MGAAGVGVVVLVSVETLALVLHHSRATGTDKLVLLGIANHSGDGGAWPSVATLARYANVTERNVRKALDRLTRAGEVVIHQQQGGTATMRDHERPNRYDVMVSCPPGCDRTASHRVRDLPDAPAGLWIEGVSPATAEPSIEPSSNPLAVATDSYDRARDVAPPCSTCSLAADECRRREATSGHVYNPRGGRA